jgi:glycosyltransferase involved in cell wall biosynthesis
MTTIIYPYRNRELSRIKRSLDSLEDQSCQDFRVLFIDYGSDEDISFRVQELISQYTFVRYEYLYTKQQPWSKCKALNYAIKKLDTGYCFVADVDMIFHPNFIELLMQKCHPNTVTYFKVGFLSKAESSKSLSFQDYKIKFYSSREATGMSLFPVEKLVEVHGFDEFFHFWGAEDTDLHNRLKNGSCEISYYDEKTMLLHQWHPNYRKRETKKLNTELQLTGVVELNHLHLLHNLKHKKTKVNINSWGICMAKTDYEFLKNAPVVLIDTQKNNIDYFLFNELAGSKDQIIAVQIKKSPIVEPIKYRIKRFLGKKTVIYYDLKTINDLLLQQIISYYHLKPYFFEIADDLESVIFKIKT